MVWNRPLNLKFSTLSRVVHPLDLADLPTPVQALEGVGKKLKRQDLWIKRDDLSSKLYGGNKVRKLEFLLGQARDRGAKRILTMGGTGSNHLLATALHGNTLGFKTIGVVFNQPITEAVRRKLLAYEGANVELIRIGSKYNLVAGVAWGLLKSRLRYGSMPFLIPGGGSNSMGALGFVNAGLELASQIQEGQLPEPHAVFVPYGTGGTALGLAAGLQLAGLSCRVKAVRVIDRLVANRPRMDLFAKALYRLLKRLDPSLHLVNALGHNLDIVQGYIGRGYGYCTDEAKHAQEMFMHEQGLKLELTYTAKAAAAFLDRAEKNTGPILFWNTYSSSDIQKWVDAGIRKAGAKNA